MPNSFDLALAIVIAVVWPLYEFLSGWPNHLKRLKAGDRDARPKIYRRMILQQWVITAAILAVTIAFHRSFADTLWLRAPQGWRLPVAVGLPLAYAVLLIVQIPAIARKPRARARLRELFKDADTMTPSRSIEWGWFQSLSLTAGICEELIYRGYLVWILTPWLGVWGGAAVSVACFGLAHCYLGRKLMPRALVTGLGLQALTLLTGSILPAIAFHILLDLGSGYVAYLAQTPPSAAEAAA